MSDAPPQARGARALYLSYDGMCDPLGASQVLPYLCGLAKRGNRITLISFEKPNRRETERAAVRQVCTSAGIAWHPLTYHKHPPILSSMYDVAAMGRLALKLHRRERFDLVHCRSYLAGLAGLKLKRRTGLPFVFDMRGFWADERRESGLWNMANPLFRSVYWFFKNREREFWEEADQLVSLTDEAKGEILRKDPAAARIDVIPCCVDFAVFEPSDPEARCAVRRRLGIPVDAKVLAYLGSLGGNYMLSEMLDVFRLYRHRHDDAHFLFVTHAPEHEIKAVAVAKGIPSDAIIVTGANRVDVPSIMAAADAGIAFKRPSFSAMACCPTKLAEMLALELPVITNAGVGDVERIMADSGAGALVRRFDQSTYAQALDTLERLKPDMGRWREAARQWFDLEVGVGRYDAIYRRILNAAVGSQ